MSVALTAEAMQSALASVSTRLPAESPLLSQCIAVAADCELSCDSFASRWDAFKFSHNLRALDAATLPKLSAHLMEEHQQQQRKRGKREEKSRAAAAAGAGGRDGGVRVTGGVGGKRVYSKETLSELLAEDEMLSGLLPMSRVSIKSESRREAEDRASDWAVDNDPSGGWSDKEEKKQPVTSSGDAGFRTPTVIRHRPSVTFNLSPPSTSSTTSSSSSSPSPLLPGSPFTPSSASAASTAAVAPATPSSAYQSRADPGKVVLTLHPALAPASNFHEVDNNNSQREVEVEALLSLGEMADAEDGRPFRFGWLAGGGAEVRELLRERMELLVQRLMAGSEWRAMAAAMKAEAGARWGLKEEDEKVKEEEKKDSMDIEDSKQEEKAVASDMEERKDGAEEEEKRAAVTSAAVKRELDVEISDLEEVGLSSTAARSQQTVVVCGRVCIDANSDDSRLSLSSVCLEGSFALSHCHRINLRLGSLSSFSLFPGQIVLAKGVNAHGTAMVVEQLVTAAPPPVLSLPFSSVQRYNATGCPPLTIVAAAGPFTTTEDLSFAPLADLVERVNLLHADVLVLQGPFLELSHPLVLSGAVDMEEKMQQFWPEFFGSLNSHTRVIIQPSTRDALHVPIFPQPPFAFPHPRHVSLVSNPATVRVNDVVLGLVSLDVLSHFVSSSACLTRNVRTKRLPHVASLLVAQHSYYPLFPPPVTADCVDYSHSLRFTIPVKPDILLLPSALGKFVSDSSEAADGEGGGEATDGATLAVNAGSLARAGSGGTYAVICVHGKSDDEMARGSDDAEDDGRVREHLVARRTRVDVQRI